MSRFKLRAYNEFDGTRWSDFISIQIYDFRILLVRKYDFFLEGPEEPKSVLLVEILGFNLFNRCIPFVE